MNGVNLERALPSQRETLANLVQLYVHDFNDFLAPGRKIGVEDNGLFADVLRLEEYWTQPDRSVWFIRVSGAVAGFALLNRASHSGKPVDRNMGEFFVTRTFRRDGVGARAAIDIINRHPGQWEIAIGARNEPAKKFWPRVAAAANSGEIEHIEGDGVQWTGPIIRMRVR